MATQLIPLNQFEDNPYQTRTSYNEEGLWALANDIREQRPLRPETCGLLQIPLGRWIEKDDIAYPGAPVQRIKKVQLAFGHRRWRAFLRLRNKYGQESGEDWSVMPVDLADLSDEQMYRLCAAENGQRSDLNPIEKARSIKRGVDDLALTLEQSAKAHGYKDKSTASNLVRLLELPREVQQLVEKGDLDARHARELLPLVQIINRPDAAIYHARLTVENDWPAATLANSVAANVSRETAQVGMVIADFSDWQDSQLPDGCAPICVGCQFFKQWKHQPVCTRPELYSKKDNAYFTRNQNQEALARALHKETRYCRFCGHPQEIIGRELHYNDRVTCLHCYRAWPAPNWPTEPPPPRPAQPPAPNPQPLSIWQLEQKVRHWLDDPDEPLPDDGKIEILEAIKTKTGQGPWYFEQIRDSFEEPCQDGDLRQACHNVLNQLQIKNQTAISSPLPLGGAGGGPELAVRETTPIEYRQTPPGQPTVADLAPVGHYVISNYDYGRPYKIIGCSQHKSSEGQSTHSLTLAHAHRSPRKGGTYGRPDGWMNELVAVDGRILKLFKANTDEAWVFPDEESARAAQSERERIKKRFSHLAWPNRLAQLNAWLDEVEQRFSQENHKEQEYQQ